MALRGSLKSCVEAAIGRYRRGHNGPLMITCNDAGKYYTLLTPAEYEAGLDRIQRTHQRLVLNTTGGELSSIIGTAQMKLGLGGPDASDT
jgi:hypothetical protein